MSSQAEGGFNSKLEIKRKFQVGDRVGSKNGGIFQYQNMVVTKIGFSSLGRPYCDCVTKNGSRPSFYETDLFSSRLRTVSKTMLEFSVYV